MKNVRKNINLYLFTIICVAIVLAMVFSIDMAYSVKSETNANAAVIMSSFVTKDGYLYDENNVIITSGDDYDIVDGRAHLKASKFSSAYPGKTIQSIGTASELRSYLESGTKDVGILTNDIDYNMPALGILGSGSTFTKTLDGNAYTITITPPAAGSDITTTAGWSDPTNTFGESQKYSYLGMLVGVNAGVIKNANVTLEVNDTSEMNTNVSSTSSGATLISSDAWNEPIISGIICGLIDGTSGTNGTNGVVSNCTVNVNGAYAVGKAHKGKNIQNNFSAAGGVSGAFREGLITRTTVINNGGILALADGEKAGVIDAGTEKAGAAAGGIVGIIYSGLDTSNNPVAKIKNCSIAGSGSVVAMCAHDVARRNQDGVYGFSGGVVAGDVYTVSDGINSRGLADGQIDGIISAWTGTRKSIWRQDSKDSFNVKTIYGCLFDVILADSDSATKEADAISNIVIAYDYIAYAQSRNSNYTTLDSNGKILYGNWSEIFAQNAGGKLSLQYDYAASAKPIRVEAVADGYVPLDIETHTVSNNDPYVMEDNAIGKFIWGLQFVLADTTATTNDIITPNQSYVAYVDYVNTSTPGKYIYTFGEKCNISFVNTNTKDVTPNYVNEVSKNYDGEKMLMPNVVIKNKDNDVLVTNTDACNLTIEYTVLGDIENENYTIEAAEAKLPGKYEVDSKVSVNHGDNGSANYKYYDEDAHILANYNDSKYTYYINSGAVDLLNISCNSDSVTWLSSDVITFNYANQANTIDYYNYSRGNDAAGVLKDMPSTVNAEIAIEESGKYYYTVNTFVENPYYKTDDPDNSTQYILVASKSIQVFVDSQAPVIKNVKYYIYDESKPNNKGSQISVLELEEWQYDDVLVEYEVRDSNLSGLVSGNGHSDYVVVNDSRWNCTLRLTGANSSQMVYDEIEGVTYATQQVTYQDAAGNVVSHTFRAKIDTTQLDIVNVKALNRGEYLSYVAQLGYCPTSVKISFTPVFGASGAHMYYSYEQDTNGNDIWVKYDAALKANQPNTFVINFELNNKPFKMKLVSDENMYADAFANGDGFVRNGAENDEDAKVWNVKIIIAGIGITLDNLYYGSTSLSSMSESELNALFNKTYNASEISEVELTAKVYSTGTELIANTILIYSDQYLYTTPAVEESYLKVVASFASKNAGTWDVTLRVDSVEEYYNKYLVRFLTGSTTANLNELTTDTSKYLISKKVATSTIDKAIMEIDLANYPEQLSSSYVYGDNIPSQITVEGEGEIITLNLITDAKITKDDDDMLVYPNVGSYPVDAELAGEIANYNLAIISTNITIVKKGVTVTPRLDGNVDFNTTITFDGLEHAITGTYKDVFNETKNATIKYYSEKECINEIEVTESGNVLDVNVYFAKITIDNSNYEVTNNGNPIKFTITKGYLDLDLESQTKSFAGQNISFEIKTKTAVNSSYYEDGTFTINYYKVTDNVADFSTTVNPFEVGRYLVQITFAGSENFYDKPYDDTYLTINKAATVTSANNITVVYDEHAHKFALIDTGIKVSANGGNTTVIKVENEALKYYAYNGSQAVEGDASEAIEVRFVDPDTLTPMLIDDATAPEFINAGSYEFRIMFKGDDCFASSSTRINFIVDEAQFEGIEFNDAKYNFIDKNSENYHSIFVEGSTLDAYIEKGAVITYTYLGDNYVDKGEKGADISNGTKWIYQSGVELDSNPLSFNNVGEYKIFATLTLENYKTLNISATLEIDKTAMPNVLPQNVTLPYTGTFITGEFTIENHTMHKVYYVGYESSKYIEYFTMDDDDERIYVYYDSNAAPVNVGDYVGTITLKSTTYADTLVKVRITIEPAVVTEVSFDSIEDIYDKIDSNTDLSVLYPTFRFGGEEYAAEYEYYDLNENKVELSSDGTLAPGEYIVRVKFSDGNYASTDYLPLEVSEAKESGGKDGSGNKPGSGSIMDLFNQYKLPIIIGGAVLVVAIVGIVLGVSLGKKKKAKARKKRKPTKPSGNGGARKAPPAPERKSQAPVKKERREGPQDKAQF